MEPNPYESPRHSSPVSQPERKKASPKLIGAIIFGELFGMMFGFGFSVFTMNMVNFPVPLHELREAFIFGGVILFAFLGVFAAWYLFREREDGAHTKAISESK